MTAIPEVQDEKFADRRSSSVRLSQSGVSGLPATQAARGPIVSAQSFSPLDHPLGFNVRKLDLGLNH